MKKSLVLFILLAATLFALDKALITVKTATINNGVVIVTNQDGLGTASHPRAAWDKAHRFILDAFASQGITFEAVLICPHFAADGCECRKPATGLVRHLLRDAGVDLARSAVVGDRDTDLELARNLGAVSYTHLTLPTTPYV